MSLSSIKKLISKENIGVILPSRGMLFTETLNELCNELYGRTYTIYWSHGNSLPDCFNKPLKRALKASHTHYLIVEDDVVLKPGLLQEMFNMDEDVVSCDYPVHLNPSGCVLYDFHDRAIFTGTGFMLIKRHVLDEMPKPIFRSDISWDFKSRFDKIVFTARDVKPEEVYGQHDVTFGIYQYLKGKPVAVHKTALSQRKLKTKGNTSNNDGTDEIILYDNYKKINFLSIPQSEQDHRVTEIILDGKRTYVATDTAKRLVAEKRAEYGSIHVEDIILEVDNSINATQFIKGA